VAVVVVQVVADIIVVVIIDVLLWVAQAAMEEDYNIEIMHPILSLVVNNIIYLLELHHIMEINHM
jgi:hypothetical protein